MGGSYYACYAPVTALASAGVTAVMVDSAELLYFRRPTLGGGTLLVAVSQSGESAEVVRLIEELDRAPARPFVVSVTNGLQNSLARMANVGLDSHAGREQGPSTMTFSAALVVLALVAAVLRGEPAENALQRAWLGNRPILTLLARGALRAASEMGALTLKEAARFPAEAMEAAQFRHGPLELAGQETAVVLIVTEAATREVDARLAAELVKAGVAVLRICGDGAEVAGAETITLGEVDPLLAAAPAIVPIQLLAWQLAIDRGLKPGTLIRASKITVHE
jgi:glucosamine--fructose-6-phosphate aminotransferase (isomerizing)